MLGPCLFLIYINDIDDAIDCAVTLMRKFADDTKVAAVTDTKHQCAKFQEQINCLARWAQIWQMTFNLDKCVIVHLGNHNLQHQYETCNYAVKTTEFEKNIKVHIHTSLKPSAHIGEIVKKQTKLYEFSCNVSLLRDKYHTSTCTKPM